MDNNLQNIARIVDYIEAHLDDKLDLANLAREAGYSKYHLRRMFTSASPKLKPWVKIFEFDTSIVCRELPVNGAW